jgi:hypothetical protein
MKKTMKPNDKALALRKTTLKNIKVRTGIKGGGPVRTQT